MNKIPITILTGYLGSGKTTILRHIMKNTDRKIGVLVNEIGEIDVDGALIEKNTEEIIKFSDKCMCCAIRGDIVDSINNLIKNFSPSAIIIETSGQAHPVPVALAINEDPLAETCYLDAIICIVDAVNIFDIVEKDHTLMDQLVSSDFVILTKTDLVDSDQKEKVISWLKRMKPATPIIESHNGEVDFSIISEQEASHEFATSALLDEHDHHHLDSVSVKIDGQIKKKKFTKFLDSLDTNIYRAKGFINTDHGIYVFHKVGQRWELEPIEESPYPENVFVFIGTELEDLNLESKVSKLI